MNHINESLSFYRFLGKVTLDSIIRVYTWGRNFSCWCRSNDEKDSTTRKTRDLSTKVISQLEAIESKVSTPLLSKIPNTPTRANSQTAFTPLLVPEVVFEIPKKLPSHLYQNLAHLPSTDEVKQEEKEEDEILSVTQSIDKAYQRIIRNFPLHILDNLKGLLIDFEEKYPQITDVTKQKILNIRKELQETPSIIDRLHSNRLLNSHLEILGTIPEFLPLPEIGEFLNHLKALYLVGTRPFDYLILMAFANYYCSINPNEQQTNITYTLTYLATKRYKLLSIQNRRLRQLLEKHKEDWFLQAANCRHKKLLINRHTKAGKALIQACNGRSLRQEFNVHTILVDHKGHLFIRYSFQEPFAIGGYKEIFKIKEYQTQKRYAWIVLKNQHYLKTFNSDVFSEFRHFLEEHPELAFNPVSQFIEYRNTTKQQQIGVSLEDLYLDDIYNLRVETPFLKGSDILALSHALTCMHAHGFVHLDLKPENILIKENRKEEKSVVWNDYDFTQKADQPLKNCHGTPGFMPIEYLTWQHASIKVDLDLPRVDTFAFAVTLSWDLDTNFVPFSYLYSKKEDYLSEIASSSNLPPSEVTTDAYDRWLETKQTEHEVSRPKITDRRPYFAYRKLLWTAMSPDFNKRPDAATFENELKALYAQGELPT